MNKKIGIVVLVLLLGAIVFSFWKNQSHSIDKAKVVKEIRKAKKSSKNTSQSRLNDSREESIIQEEERNHSMAQDMLEASDKTIEDSKILEDDLGQVMEYLVSVQNDDFQMTYENKLSLTRKSVGQLINELVNVGQYTVSLEELEVYQSDHENVYQFVLPLSKENSPSLYLVGNYVIETRQIEIGGLQGNATGLEGRS